VAPRRALAALVASLALTAVPAGPAAAAERVPAGFFGMVAEPDLLEDRALAPAGSSLEQELARMSAAGVGAVRMSFFWARVQPYRTWEDVPEPSRGHFTDVRGRPYAFAHLDRIMAAAARHRIDVLPVLLWAPYWAARHRGEFASPPSDPADYANYLAVLAERYGPGGRFWDENPGLRARPVRDWQAWNEPTMPTFWLDQPFARGYVKLLRAARPALRRVDPRGRLVLAGLVYDSPGALRSIYRAGGRKHFDVAAVHPFTLHVRNVAVLVGRARGVMRENGDGRKPLLVTELSWPSAKGRTRRGYGYETSERGQAARVAQALPYLARRRRALGVERVYWYTWMTRERDRDYPFDYAGLSRLEEDRVVDKPALSAFRRTARALRGLR
jgi:hypothetical protein